MSYSVEKKFDKYKVTSDTEKSAHTWDDAELYKTSYYQESAKNPYAVASTEQLLEVKSNNLRSISTKLHYRNKPIENKDFIRYDYNNLYRSSYNDMHSKNPRLLNSFYIPKYAGFVPGMRSENPFGANYTTLAKKQIDNFDNKRYGRETETTYKEWKYNPISTIIGNFWNKKEKKFNVTLQSSLSNHDYTPELRDSGFSENLFPTKLSSALLNKCFDSDMKRTEYRIQYNRNKDFHYKMPSFNTGVLKMKETNYKHT